MKKRTSEKPWARIYFFVFRLWPEKVVDERMARVEAFNERMVRMEHMARMSERESRMSERERKYQR